MADIGVAVSAHDSALSDSFADVAVHSIEFVVRRRPDKAWMIRDVLYPRLHTLVWASAGRAHYEAAGMGFEVGRGQMLYLPAGFRRSARSDPVEPWAFYSIGFTLAALPAAADRLAALPRVATPSDGADVGAAVHELDQQWHAHSAGSQLRCRGIVSQLLGIYVQAAMQKDDHSGRRPSLVRIIDLLRTGPRRIYTADELAARAGLSPSRFRVLFRQATGTSALRFQNGLRVRRAIGLLRSGEHTVTEVAELVGYSDLFYFSRQFKQFTGAPPSAYLAR